MQPNELVDFLGQERVSAILRCDDQGVARRAMHSAVEGGFRVIELTMTIPGVLDLIEEFANLDGVVVGAGTVLETDQARAVVDRGARFVVSPVVDEVVIETATELGVAVMPGTHTPTEMWRAHRAGAQLVKLFPAPGLGPAYVRSVLGPMPFLNIVPTNGVDEENLVDWLEAGAHAVGMVAPLFRPDDLAAGRWDDIRKRSKRFVDLAQGASAR